MIAAVKVIVYQFSKLITPNARARFFHLPNEIKTYTKMVLRTFALLVVPVITMIANCPTKKQS